MSNLWKHMSNRPRSATIHVVQTVSASPQLQCGIFIKAPQRGLASLWVCFCCGYVHVSCMSSAIVSSREPEHWSWSQTRSIQYTQDLGRKKKSQNKTTQHTHTQIGGLWEFICFSFCSSRCSQILFHKKSAAMCLECVTAARHLSTDTFKQSRKKRRGVWIFVLDKRVVWVWLLDSRYKSLVAVIQAVTPIMTPWTPQHLSWGANLNYTC